MKFFDKLFNETEDLLFESTETTEKVMSELMKYYKAIPRPSGPVEIRSASNYLKSTGEYKLYQFLQNCKFLEVPSGQGLPNWYETAGVTPPINGKVLFLYDANFVTKCVKFYYKDKQIEKKEFNRLNKEGVSDDDLKIDQSELLFLIAHEALHVYRFHGETARKKGLNASTHNTAADSIINYQLENDIKVIGKDRVKMIKNGIMIPKDKFMAWAAKKPEYKGKNFRQLLNSEITYQFYLETEKEKPKPPPEPSKDLKVGDIVHVKGGKGKGKYIKITSISKKGKIKGDVVDIADEKKKFKASNQGKSSGFDDVKYFEAPKASKSKKEKKEKKFEPPTHSKYSRKELSL